MSRRSIAAPVAEASVSAAPYLVAVAPIVALWASNRNEFGPAEGGPPVLVAVVAAALLLGLSRAVTADRGGAASIAAAGLAALAFGFGYELDLVTAISSQEQAWQLAPVVGLIDLAIAISVLLGVRHLVRRHRIDGSEAARAIAVGAVAWMAVALVAGPQQSQAGGVPAIGAEYLRNGDPVEPTPAPLGPVQAPPGQPLPDVYYVILDGYARWDILASEYGYDERPFLETLADRGFYVAEASNSNYPGTHPSLSSSLNMRYVTRELSVGAPFERYLELIRNNEVATAFKSLGYRYDLVRSVWIGTAISPLADRLLGMGPPFGSEFAVALANRSILRAITTPPTVAESHLVALRDLEAVAMDPAPTFTFAHVILPHPPYVLDRDGNIVNRTATLEGVWLLDDAKAGYVEQVRFLNRRLIEIVDGILAASATRPIIVFQGDHGAFVDPGPDDPDGRAARLARLAILNAYLVPDEMRSDLYPSISPVNSFRIVLPRLVGRQPELLPDRHFPYEGPSREGFEEATPSPAR